VTISPEGGRVLGCLAEKQLTTPQQYPLTRNALALACSQATNREPVMSLDDEAVQQPLQELKELHLVRFVLPSHGKSVTRYRHVLDEQYGLDPARVALLAVLLLRGPQTPGELRARTGRMVEFDSVAAVQTELEVLADQPEPLVRLLPRRPGQKEDRWQQLLAVESDTAPTASPDPGADEGGAATAADPVGHRTPIELRLEAVVSEVQSLREQVDELRDALDSLRRNLGE
jgi:uncharacterized protein YceH (UPF0502 family)